MTIKWRVGFKSGSLLLIVLSIFSIAQLTKADFLDKIMKRCSEGDMQACDEIDKIAKKYKSQLERLNAQADKFQDDAPSLSIEENKTPNIKKAYAIILKRYISSKTIEPAHKLRGLNDGIVDICGRHLRDLYCNCSPW